MAPNLKEIYKVQAHTQFWRFSINLKHELKISDPHCGALNNRLRKEERKRKQAQRCGVSADLPLVLLYQQ